MTTHPTTPTALDAKQLPAALAGAGFPGFTYKAALRLIAAMRAQPGAGVIRRHFVGAEQAAAWLRAHPDWTPFGRDIS